MFGKRKVKIPVPGSPVVVVDEACHKQQVEETLRRFSDLLGYLLPLYKREGKSYLTVGIGCTGGRHRSVMIANELASRLKENGFNAQSVHRDVRKQKASAR